MHTAKIEITIWVESLMRQKDSPTCINCIPHCLLRQHAKKVVSDSPGLVDFAIGLVKSVFNLPDGQVMFYEEFE